MPTKQSRKSSSKKSTPVEPMVPDDRIIDFLGFPSEIRNNIYDYVCVKPTYIGSNAGKLVKTKQFYKDAATWRNLAFATSCKQIYIEASHVFYARNGFEFYYIRSLLEFLETIGLGGRSLLTKLRILYVRSGTPFIALRYLKSCKNLQELEVYITWGSQIGYALIQPLHFFLGDLTKIEFGDAQQYGSRLEVANIRTTLPADDQRLKSLTESLEKIKNGEDGRYKGRDLPDVFAETSRSLVYRSRMVKIMRKSEEEELKKQQRIRDLKETEGWLTKLRNFNAKVADENGFTIRWVYIPCWVNIYNPASLKKRALRLRLELGMDPATEGGNEENEGESSMQ